LIAASACTIAIGIRSPAMAKNSSERCVCAPQSRSAGTSMMPNESRSLRVAFIAASTAA
jgi:hypothetical protein